MDGLRRHKTLVLTAVGAVKAKQLWNDPEASANSRGTTNPSRGSARRSPLQDEDPSGLPVSWAEGTPFPLVRSHSDAVRAAERPARVRCPRYGSAGRVREDRRRGCRPGTAPRRDRRTSRGRTRWRPDGPPRSSAARPILRAGGAERQAVHHHLPDSGGQMTHLGAEYVAYWFAVLED